MNRNRAWSYEQIQALIDARRTTNQVNTNTFYYLKIQILLIYIIIFLGIP